jgi:hypothetical protein
MGELTTKNFGLLVAYILPGFTVLWAISPYSPTVQTWLGTTTTDAPTVGGFLYVTLGSVAAGLMVSALRWLLLDTLHHRTGIPKPHWDFSQLDAKLNAFDVLNEQHYRYFQFYGNMLVAICMGILVRPPVGESAGEQIAGIVLLVSVGSLLFIASRDTLRNYYRRVAELLH